MPEVEAAAVRMVGRLDAAFREELRVAPYDAITARGEVAVRFQQVGGTCGVYGTYNSHPPTITVEPMSFERDNFTILHELGHHYQEHDADWADRLWRLHEHARPVVQETFANAFASEVLLPEANFAHLTRWNREPTAKDIRDAYFGHQASPQATLVAIRKHNVGARMFVALVDTAGLVSFALSLDDELAHPPFNSVQPDLGNLASAAARSDDMASRGRTSDGIVYRSGASRTGLILDAAMITNEIAVVTARPEAGRYARAQWGRQEVECHSPACGDVFVWDESVSVCQECGSPRCPECRECSCEETSSGTCVRCNLPLYPVDLAAGRTEHEVCW